MFMDERADENDGTPTPAGETLVAVRKVAKRYGACAAIENLDLTVRAGEVFGLVGANGGGKTTTLRILAGILPPDEGRGRVLGFDLIQEAKEIRRHIGYMSQRLSLYADLTVFENLRFRAEVYGLHKPCAAAEATIQEFELEPYARSRAGQLSGGWARRLQLAAALIHAPTLILLDEPTAGLDVVSRRDAWQRIGRLAARGAAVIVSSHDLGEAERCSNAALLSEGRVVAVGTPLQIARSAPAAAFLLSGAEALMLQQSIKGTAGLITTYQQGDSLRVVATSDAAAENLAHAASINGLSISRVTMRLEDAVLAYFELSSWRGV
jgi:ABC-2 type transport system ATP-binding protein